MMPTKEKQAVWKILDSISNVNKTLSDFPQGTKYEAHYNLIKQGIQHTESLTQFLNKAIIDDERENN